MTELSRMIANLILIDDLDRSGQGDSQEAEKLRDELDVVWPKLTRDESRFVVELCAVLNQLHARSTS